MRFLLQVHDDCDVGREVERARRAHPYVEACGERRAVEGCWDGDRADAVGAVEAAEVGEAGVRGEVCYGFGARGEVHAAGVRRGGRRAEEDLGGHGYLVGWFGDGVLALDVVGEHDGGDGLEVTWQAGGCR